jgi:hypothetical protein
MSDRQEIQRARAFGLLLGLAEGMALNMGQPMRDKAQAVIEEARELWDGDSMTGPRLSNDQVIEVMGKERLRRTPPSHNSAAF